MAIAIAEYGPEINTERGFVSTYIVDVNGTRWNYDRLGVFEAPWSGLFDLHQCREDECAMKPGAIYRKAVG